MVGLVIPAYNEEQYLPRLLSSALNQSVKFSEITVVDSGSTDRTVEIAKKFGARVITGKRCVNYNRHIGIISSRSHIVACVDADSMLNENYVKSIKECFDSSTVALVAPAYNDNPVQRSISLLRELQSFMKEIFTRDYNIPIPFGANMIIRRTSYLKVGGFKYMGNCRDEENDLYERLSRIGIVKYCKGAYIYTSGRKFSCLPNICNRLSKGGCKCEEDN